MNYFSVCSGVDSATLAWRPLGWSPVGFSEIDPFCCAVLKSRFNGVTNYGDLRRWKTWRLPNAIDVCVGGTPCQSFSVAGLRKGMGDERGNLSRVYAQLVGEVLPRWLVWENVPGVLSSNNGRDFGSIVGALVKFGYGVCWRVLDAQYVRVDGFGRAVPQRRRRVFLVGNLGDWRRSAAVLFDRESLHGNTPPRRQTRQDVVGSLNASAARSRGAGIAPETLIVDEVAPTLSSRRTGGGGLGTDFDLDGGLIAFGCKDYGQDETLDVSPTLRSMNERESNSAGGGQVAVLDGSRVRRLTPRECERLQGFPDDFTKIYYRGKPAKDAPRYKALGNAIAVNCLRWIGRRIELVEGIAL